MSVSLRRLRKCVHILVVVENRKESVPPNVETMEILRIITIALLLIQSFSTCICAESIQSTTTSTTRPRRKYRPPVKRLFRSHDYISTHEALDYWAISPYYIGQQDDRSCSLASVTMIVNAARVEKALLFSEKLPTQQSVMKRVNSEIWNSGLAPGGEGVTLDQIKSLIEKSFKTHSIKYISVEIIHTVDLSEETKQKFRRILVENEKSSRNFLIANFNGGKVFSGDDYGHFAPIAAYDAGHRQILVMDPERQWYEPYWVSEDALLNAMVTKDKKSDQYRGYVWIKLFGRKK
ncbi:unnamed protein product [Didymodactylos carnosus]|uniref:glutathione gamma-glutamylcysteinyltransferase n=1 Tax=Didymodactylos carnosus TaxID=1234261 RepID=A0A815GCQ4_9BILA|nr:unnamed protein product [Didymodactylos carnosus]CAF1336922.1 unnamed protein product [Didymodactylos carnosus]CAF4061254.1 unnamed protein product [Didymodactylos carnosus]CAF4194810.1 unnamed protein product [Didymodactylos carnosus]